MTNEELKKKILGILDQATGDWYEKDDGLFAEGYTPEEGDNRFKAFIADALIAAGIGYLKEHRVFAGKDGSIKQLYSDEEVEKILKERNELKVELRDKVDYIHEQDEVIKEYKHRAEVAERALWYACKSILKDRNDTERRVRAYFKAYIDRAEKELAEEGKDANKTD